MSTWIAGKIVNVKYWTDQLFSIVIHAAVDRFIAGQFTKIGMKIDGVLVQRAYSYLNAPDNVNLEFYIATVVAGKLSPLLRILYPNSFVMITKESFGRFVLDEIPECENLWMFATGTGISPYLSILMYHEKRLDYLSNIVLVHAVRFSKNLNYLFQMMKLQKIYRGRLHIQTILSQEKSTGSLYGRIPTLIENNVLEKKIGLNLDVKNSHVMLCGNPYMIYDTKMILKRKYGMKDHFRRSAGQISQERYW